MPAPGRTVRPPEAVAARLARAVERRRTAVYVPSWLRCLQVVRCALPPVVLRVARHELPRLDAGRPPRASGPLDSGGRADRAAAGPGER